ncbi:hypothetical protein A0H81_12003 [Grifola frondosa]|uniref:Uncharacterized protein n=1 Tax=Grifola frondosa TaxID=5627 RepID=A0A1C7LVK0_GRIFR|nr:hypothetical protein A0H81_12003 [Grifola frondosa]
MSPEQMTIYGDACNNRRKKLREWFSNNRGNNGRAAANAKTIYDLVTSSATKGKATRQYQAVEVYSKKYYSERVGPLVKAEIQAQGRRLSRKEILDIIKRITRTVFDAESDEVKAEITAEMEIARAEQPAKAEPSSGERTPEEYQTALNEMPGVVNNVLSAIAQQTGCTIFALVGGPSPVEGGAIRTMSIHVGATEQGQTFEHSCENFEAKYVTPFNTHLKTVYPPHIRNARALQTSRNSASSSRAITEEASTRTTSPGLLEVPQPVSEVPQLDSTNPPASFSFDPTATSQLSTSSPGVPGNNAESYSLGALENLWLDAAKELENDQHFPADLSHYSLSNPSGPLPSDLFRISPQPELVFPRLPDHLFADRSENLDAALQAAEERTFHDNLCEREPPFGSSSVQANIGALGSDLAPGFSAARASSSNAVVPIPPASDGTVPVPTPSPASNGTAPSPTPPSGATAPAPIPTPPSGATAPVPTPSSGATAPAPVPTPPWCDSARSRSHSSVRCDSARSHSSIGAPAPRRSHSSRCTAPVPTPPSGATTPVPVPTPPSGATAPAPVPTPPSGATAPVPVPTPPSGATAPVPTPPSTGEVTPTSDTEAPATTSSAVAAVKPRQRGKRKATDCVPIERPKRVRTMPRSKEAPQNPNEKDKQPPKKHKKPARKDKQPAEKDKQPAKKRGKRT